MGYLFSTHICYVCSGFCVADAQHHICAWPGP